MLGLQPIPPNLSRRYQELKNSENSIGLLLAPLIVIFAGTVLLIQHCLAPGVARDSFDYQYYIITYCYCITSGLFCAILSKQLNKVSIRMQIIGFKIIVILVVFAGVFLVIGDILTQADLSVFILTLLLIDILYRGSMSFIFILYSVCYSLVLLGAHLIGGQIQVYIYVQLFVYAFLSLVVWIGLERVRRMNFLFKVDLEEKIAEREKAERKLQATQQKLIETAHKAGKAELAADSLHNIGNTLNSVHVSAHLINKAVEDNPGISYTNACQLIRENSNDFPRFIAENPRGQKLIEYLLLLDGQIKSSFQSIGENICRLIQKIDTIKKIIASQQEYVDAPFIKEELDICHEIDSVLAMIPEICTDPMISIDKEYGEVPSVRLQKTKFLQALFNLFNNSVDAMESSTNKDKRLSITVLQENDAIIIKIADSGCGIPQENLAKIFSHGFTTKKDGHGFGLHATANSLMEMGAKIIAESPGREMGSVFTISLPLR